MTVYLVAVAGTTPQYFSDQGVIGAGYQIVTYLAGTTTLATTYTDSTGSIPNSNPIILAANGRLPASVWVPSGTSIKMVLQSNNGAPVSNATIDNLPGINDPAAALAAGLTQTLTGTFTGLLTGMTGVTSVAVSYCVVGNVCSIFGSGTGTSNVNTMTMTGLVAPCVPASAKCIIPCILETNGQNVGGWALVQAGSNTITFWLFGQQQGVGFDTFGTKGLPSGWSITYSVG